MARESKHWRFIKMSTGCSFFLKVIDTIRHHVGLSRTQAAPAVQWRGNMLGVSQIGRKKTLHQIDSALGQRRGGRLPFLCALRAHFVGNTHEYI